MTKVTPRNNDVLFGRGYSISAHPGNQILRCVVRSRKPLFLRTSKSEKRDVARRIAEDVRVRLGGRFLVEKEEDEEEEVEVMEGREADDDDDDGGSRRRRRRPPSDVDRIRDRNWKVVHHERAVSKVMHRLREKDVRGEKEDQDQEEQDGNNNGNGGKKKKKERLSEGVDGVLRMIDSSRASGKSEADVRRAVRGMASDLLGEDNEANNDVPRTLSCFLRNIRKLEDFDPPKEEEEEEEDRRRPVVVPETPDVDSNGAIPQVASERFDVGSADNREEVAESFYNRQVYTGGTTTSTTTTSDHPNRNPQQQPGLCLPPPPVPPLLAPNNAHVAPVVRDHYIISASAPTTTSSLASHSHPPVRRSAGAGGNNNNNDDGRNLFLREATTTTTTTTTATEQFSVHAGTLFPMSIAEFAHSGRLAGRRVVLQEDDEVPPTPERTESGTNDRLVVENAVRLALLLARSFLAHLSEINLVSIQLDDFFIYAEPDLSEKCAEALLSKVASNSQSKWVLLGVDLLPSTLVCGPRREQDESEATRILGQLLYSVFSFGGSLPHGLLTKSSPSSLEEEAGPPVDDGERFLVRSSKMSRTQESTVFSRLVESNALPLSICRLISDMVDTGSAGRASCPFRSLDEVAHDLGQMIRRPETFLHDPSFPRGASSPPTFGHNYHGRAKEVSTLREVATRMERSLHQANTGLPNDTGRLEAAFVSGIAGSGKSHLVQTAVQTLGPKWSVVKAKFERGKEHASRSIVSSMYNQLILNLVKMKENGKPSDFAYAKRATKAIFDALGHSRLALLVNFLPGLSSLFDGMGLSGYGVGDGSLQVQADDTEFRLVYSISKIIEAMLEPDRLIVMCCDDLQWADKTSLSLMSEILVNVGSLKHACSQLLFVGMFRHDEIDRDHPFSFQYAYLQIMTSNIRTTKIELSSLSKEDIGDMLMTELRLPLRVVAPLAGAVHKKTSGHALFAIELLNSLVRSSVIEYCMQRQCYTWDQDTVDIIQTGAGVAGLIASNLKSLPPASRRVLQIISCFGIQMDVSLLPYLERLENDLVCYLDTFVEIGILDRAGPIVIFTHDLIQQKVYESTPLIERQILHLEIGTCLGERANIDPSSAIESVMSGMDHLQLCNQEFYSEGSMASSLISIACDQIDLAGPDTIGDEVQRVRFAEWNHCAGGLAYRKSNARGAIYYFSKGISFLGQDPWHVDRRNLCLLLHKGAVAASFTLGDTDGVAFYAEEVTANTTFKENLEIQPIILRSLSQVGRHEESISKGIHVLCRLNIDIPVAPTPESIMKAMAMTDAFVSKFSVEQMLNLCEKEVEDSARRAVTIMDAFYTSCYVTSSPFLPLVSCAVIQFSLQQGICHEAIAAFGAYGMMKIFFAGDFAGGRYWANTVRAMLKKHQETKTSTMVMESHAHMFLHIAVDIWFLSPKTICQHLDTYHHSTMRNGQVFIAVAALGVSCRYLLLGGEKLSLLQQSYDEKLPIAAKYSKNFVAKYMALDMVLLNELTGESRNQFSIFDGSICNMKDLQDEAKSTKDLSLLQCSHVFNVLIEYWRGNYMAAEEHSRLASMLHPACKEPTIYLIYHTFFRALVLFKLHRTMGSDDKKLKDGKEMMDLMGAWCHISQDLFENKWLLLKAEYCASIQLYVEALKMYEASIKSARDNGNIHELALAHELLGDYHSDRRCHRNAIQCFKNALLYYTQWGATAKAKRISNEYNLDLGSTQDLQMQNRKHSREWHGSNQV